MTPSLDSIDLQILKDLQENGRMTNVQLAQNAGISAPPCLRRVRNLEASNVIEGYHAFLNPKALGFQITVFAHVGLISQSDNDVRAFEAKVLEWPLVRECHFIAGESDFLLKVIAQNWDQYQHFLSNQLSALSIVTNVKSQLVLRTTKHRPGIPIELIKQKIR